MPRDRRTLGDRIRGSDSNLAYERGRADGLREALEAQHPPIVALRPPIRGVAPFRPQVIQFGDECSEIKVFPPRAVLYCTLCQKFHGAPAPKEEPKPVLMEWTATLGIDLNPPGYYPHRVVPTDGSPPFIMWVRQEIRIDT